MNDAESVIANALVASVVVAPTMPGLTKAEIEQIGRRVGVPRGLAMDALQLHLRETQQWQEESILPDPTRVTFRLLHWHGPDDQVRSLPAYDFLHHEMRAAIEEMGKARAAVARGALLGRAKPAGVRVHDVEVAIAAHLIGGWLTERDGSLRPTKPHLFLREPPSKLAMKNAAGRRQQVPDALEDVLHVVRDVMARRDDGRLSYPEPLAAFVDVLPKLGYGKYDTWWRQMCAELAALNRDLTPTAYIVQCAAPLEGALTFVVRSAWAEGVKMLKDSQFAAGEERWKLVDLIHGAKRSGSRVVFSQQDAERALRLNTLRQRIHAGSYVNASRSEMDLRPEEAREARETLDHCLRMILRWVEAMPNPRST